MFNKKLNRLLGGTATSSVSNLIIVVLMTISNAACAVNPFATKENREIEPFTKIVVGGLVNVEIKQGEQEGIEISAFGIAMQDIVTSVDNDTLTMLTKGNHRGESISIEVTYRDLRAVKTSGAATIKTEGPIMTKLFKVEISDAGDASLELDVAELTIEMRDNGNLTLSGRSGVQNIKSYGGGGRLNNSRLRVGD
ncbi:MAG: hypothetical protein ACI9SP_001020 [Arenicella sp.]|jgi:hypothetical protein